MLSEEKACEICKRIGNPSCNKDKKEEVLTDGISRINTGFGGKFYSASVMILSLIISVFESQVRISNSVTIFKFFIEQ